MEWENFVKAGIRLPFYMNLFIEGMDKDVPRLFGWKTNGWLTVTQKQLTSVYNVAEEKKLFQQFLVQKMTNKRFLGELTTKLLLADTKLLEHSKTLIRQDYNSTSNATLISLFNKFTKLFRTKFGVYWVPPMIDLISPDIVQESFHNGLSDEDYTVLVEADQQTVYSEERIVLLTIVQQIVKKKEQKIFSKSNNEIISYLGRFQPELYYTIESYTRMFDWVPVTHHVQPMNLDQAIDSIRQTLKDRTAEKELKMLLSKPKHVIAKQKTLVKKNGLNNKERCFITFVRQMNILKESRKAAMSKALLWSYPLFQAIADRLDLDVISLRQLNYNQILIAMYKNKVTTEQKKIISQRLESYVCQLKDKKITEYNGPKAEAYITKKLHQADKKTKEIMGMTAQPGKVVGVVKLIRLEHQAKLLKVGEILVTSMTDPDMVPSMKKAGAIVTDEGGITCHAAIVSRELGVPCVIGTKIATQVFKDGDKVEVDATKGVIRKL